MQKKEFVPNHMDMQWEIKLHSKKMLTNGMSEIWVMIRDQVGIFEFERSFQGKTIFTILGKIAVVETFSWSAIKEKNYCHILLIVGHVDTTQPG